MEARVLVVPAEGASNILLEVSPGETDLREGNVFPTFSLSKIFSLIPKKRAPFVIKSGLIFLMSNNVFF